MRTGMMCLLSAGLFTFQAAAVPQAAPTREQSLQIQQFHEQLNQSPLAVPPPTVSRPFSDLEEAGYLFFSSDGNYDSLIAKKTMAKELPADVTLVVYTEGGDVNAIRNQYRNLIDPARLKVVRINAGGSGFWSRDGLPVPVWSTGGKMELVDAQYYHGFEPDEMIARWFSSNLLRHNYYFEGGNFMTTDDGVCIVINNDRVRGIPDSIFKGHYGCQQLIRLPFEKGIGHVDESVRVAGPRKVFTDSASYARTLQQHGFQTILLPRPRGEYETYVNSLLVNGTMFVPVFGQSGDQAALNAYRQAGFKAVPLTSVDLSNNGLGSIHCITMTYPKVPFNALMSALGLTEL